MELPIVVPAPVVTEHAADFQALFDNRCQLRLSAFPALSDRALGMRIAIPTSGKKCPTDPNIKVLSWEGVVVPFHA
jgi:hypothetical protein